MTTETETRTELTFSKLVAHAQERAWFGYRFLNASGVEETLYSGSNYAGSGDAYAESLANGVRVEYADLDDTIWDAEKGEWVERTDSPWPAFDSVANAARSKFNKYYYHIDDAENDPNLLGVWGDTLGGRQIGAYREVPGAAWHFYLTRSAGQMSLTDIRQIPWLDEYDPAISNYLSLLEAAPATGRLNGDYGPDGWHTWANALVREALAIARQRDAGLPPLQAVWRGNRVKFVEPGEVLPDDVNLYTLPSPENNFNNGGDGYTGILGLDWHQARKLIKAVEARHLANDSGAKL